ncbi:hypothetical protein ACFSE1_01410 [Rhizobium helianthi]|uniref:Uncharacterized protein n=1 Tax=Rhizobium helianthi TaxID=1132695 RepID=A0ABW4LZL6_9HYPH
MLYALCWGVVCALLVVLNLFLAGRLATLHLPSLLAVFSAGGAAGWLLSALLLLAGQSFLRGRFLRFALAFLLLFCTTLFLTSGLFALHYRSFYAQWHADAFSRDWILQFIFTSASATYQFFVIGTRLFGVASIPAFLAGSAILIRSIR